MAMIMMSNYITVYTIVPLLHVMKLTNGLPTCDTTERERLQCFTCSDVLFYRCTDSTGADQFKNWNSIKSAKGYLNNTR
jgi:hypothetical protein